MKQTNYTDIFEKLPAEIKNLVASSSTSEKIFKICQTQGIHIDLADKVNNLATDALMGIIATKDLRGEIIKAGVEPLKAAAIVRNIDEEIFKPVKDLMFHAYGDGAPFSEAGTQKTETENFHNEMDRDSLLHEIENPTNSEVKVVSNTPTSTPIPQKTNENPLTPLRPAEPAKPINDDRKTSILKSISEGKLTGITTMPKQSTIQTATEKLNITENKEEQIAVKPRPENTPETKTYSGTDPYREAPSP